MTLNFFLPESDAVHATLPGSIADYWAWQGQATLSTPYWGRYHWVLQTYLYLKEAGLPVVLVNTMPAAGVIVTHIDCVEYGFKPTAQQFFIALLVDRETAHPRADLHVLHNPVQRLHLGLKHCYMPPWPQIGLIPRDDARADRFAVLGYFGYPNNQHSSLSAPSFLKKIEALGLRMYVPAAAEWHDFSGVDCIMAIRDLGRTKGHLNKPSLKLLNAWIAGVPAILGYELAYRAEGQPNVGYLEATSADEVLDVLSVLQSDVQRRRSIVEYGRHAAKAYEISKTVERWRVLLAKAVLAAQAKGASGPIRRLENRSIGALRERVLWRRPGWF